jgi:phage terminase small subunit
MAKLTAKQEQFCKEYLIDLNGTQAAIRAGYSEDSAKEIASENLTKPNISSYIEQLMLDRSNRTTVTADKVLAEIAKMAFFNMADVIDDEGNAKPLHQWTRDDMAALQEVTETKIGKDEGLVITQKFKVGDKKANLDLLGRHLKLFTDKVEHTGGINFNDMSDEELDAKIKRLSKEL